MCGIFGIASARPIEPDLVRRGLRVVVHRGPDGQGLWRREADDAPFVGFGHCRLSIIDLSERATQPMPSRNRRIWLTYNGEIYNYQELRDELRPTTGAFRTTSDTEVLLESYVRWGEDAVRRFNGMFAFALWDEDRRCLFAARDRFGEKPFYYTFGSNEFRFASELKSLFAASDAGYPLDDAALCRYVEHDVLDGTETTLWSGIIRLLPGHCLRVEFRDGCLHLTTWRYWDIDLSASTQLSAAEAATRFQELFEDSVRLRLRADVPVGTSLSGGIDSSAVVCQIHRLGASAGQMSFSARMADPRLDEGRFIREIVRKTAVVGHEVWPRPQQLRQDFERLCYHLEEPFPTTSMFSQYLVMRLAREQGVTVLLDGQGADEMLAGYHKYFRAYYIELLRTWRWRTYWREHRRFRALRNGVRPLTWKGITAAFLPDHLRDRLNPQARAADAMSNLWSQDWLSGQSCDREVAPCIAPADRLTRALYFDSLNGPLQALLRYGDRNSMAHSVEVRQPFLDHRLAEFVFSLPASEKLQNGETKVVLRRAMRGIVPDMVLDRADKLGYQTPLGEWMGRELRDWTMGKLEQSIELLDGRVDRANVERLWRLDKADDWGMARHVFRLMTLGETISQLNRVVADRERCREIARVS